MTDRLSTLIRGHEPLLIRAWPEAVKLTSQVERGASDKDVKKAYRQLSLQYHPDKNPDPEAGRYFAESITKAYKALTGQHATVSG